MKKDNMNFMQKYTLYQHQHNLMANTLRKRKQQEKFFFSAKTAPNNLHNLIISCLKKTFL